VLVYVPRLDDLVKRIRSNTQSRSNPILATVTRGHLAGLTIAHEVGHILGLPHAASGVMKASPGLAEILSVRTSRLSFQPSDALRMRQSMAVLASHPATSAGSR
jgi:hypothetical protein